MVYELLCDHKMAACSSEAASIFPDVIRPIVHVHSRVLTFYIGL